MNINNAEDFFASDMFTALDAIEQRNFEAYVQEAAAVKAIAKTVQACFQDETEMVMHFDPVMFDDAPHFLRWIRNQPMDDIDNQCRYLIQSTDIFETFLIKEAKKPIGQSLVIRGRLQRYALVVNMRSGLQAYTNEEMQRDPGSREQSYRNQFTFSMTLPPDRTQESLKVTPFLTKNHYYRPEENIRENIPYELRQYWLCCQKRFNDGMVGSRRYVDNERKCYQNAIAVNEWLQKQYPVYLASDAYKRVHNLPINSDEKKNK